MSRPSRLATPFVPLGATLDETIYRDLVERVSRMAFPVDELIEVEQGTACAPWREEA